MKNISLQATFPHGGDLDAELDGMRAEYPQIEIELVDRDAAVFSLAGRQSTVGRALLEDFGYDYDTLPAECVE